MDKIKLGLDTIPKPVVKLANNFYGGGLLLASRGQSLDKLFSFGETLGLCLPRSSPLNVLPVDQANFLLDTNQFANRADSLGLRALLIHLKKLELLVAFLDLVSSSSELLKLLERASLRKWEEHTDFAWVLELDVARKGHIYAQFRPVNLKMVKNCPPGTG
jgi:hypothetical protein